MIQLPHQYQIALDTLIRNHGNQSGEVIDFLLSLASTCIQDPIQPRLSSFPTFPERALNLQQAVECAGQGLVFSISAGGMIGERPFLGHLILGKLLAMQEHFNEAVQELQIARGVASQIYPSNSIELGVVHDTLGSLELRILTGSVPKAYYYFTLALRCFEENFLQQKNIVSSLQVHYDKSSLDLQEETQKYNSLVRYLRVIYNIKGKKEEYQQKYNEFKLKSYEIKSNRHGLQELYETISSHQSLLVSYKQEILSIKEKIFQCTSLNGEKLLTVLELRDRITELGWVTLYNSSSLGEALDRNEQLNINYEVKKISLTSSSSVLIETSLSRPSTPTNIPVCVTPTSIKQTPSYDFFHLNTSNEMMVVPQRLGFDLDLSEFKGEETEEEREKEKEKEKEKENSSTSLLDDSDSSSETSFHEEISSEERENEILSQEASETIMRGIRYCLSLYIMRMDEEIVLNIDRLRWLLRNSISFYSSYFSHPEVEKYKKNQIFDDFISRINEEEIILALLVPVSSPSQVIFNNFSSSFSFSDSKIEDRTPVDAFELTTDKGLQSLTSTINEATITIEEENSSQTVSPSEKSNKKEENEKNQEKQEKNHEKDTNLPETPQISYTKFNNQEKTSNSFDFDLPSENNSPKPKTWRHISKNSPLRRKLNTSGDDEASTLSASSSAPSVSFTPQTHIKEENFGEEIDENEEENQTNLVLSRCPYTKKLIFTKKLTPKSNLFKYYQGKIFGTALLAWLALHPEDERLTKLKLNYSKKLLESTNQSEIINFCEESKPISPDSSEQNSPSSDSQNDDFSSGSTSFELRIIPRPPPLPTSWPPIPYTGKPGAAGSGVTATGVKLPPNSSKFRMVQISPLQEIKNSVWEKLDGSDIFKGFSPSHIFFDLKDSFSLKSKVTLGSLAKNSSALSRAGFLSALSTELIGKKSDLKKTSDDTASVHSAKSDSKNKKIISILDPQRSQNISIMLAKFSAGTSTTAKKSSSASLIWLVENILQYKYKELGLLNINMLMSYTPSVEDQSKVIKWIDDLIVSNLDSIQNKIKSKNSKFSKEEEKNDSSSTNLPISLPPKQISSPSLTANIIHALNHLNISKPDQFLYIISKIPYYNHILEIISFKLTLENQLSELTLQCESLIVLCEELLDSEKLKFFLKCVRDMYNLLMDVIYNDKDEEEKEEKKENEEKNEEKEKKEEKKEKKEYYIDGVSIDSLLKLTTIKLPQPVKLTPPPSINSSNFSSFTSRKSSITASTANLETKEKSATSTPAPSSSSSSASSASSSSTAFTYICSRIHLSMPQALPLNIREDLSNLDKFSRGWSANRLQNEISKLVTQVQEIINMSLQILEKSQDTESSTGSVPPIFTILLDVHPQISQLICLYYKCLKRIILTSRHFAQPLSLPVGNGANTFSNPSNILPIQLPPIPPAILKFIHNSTEEEEEKEVTNEENDHLSPTFEAMSSFFDSMPTPDLNISVSNNGDIDDSDIKEGSVSWWTNLFSPNNSIPLPSTGEENTILTPEGFFSTISSFCDSLDQVQTEIVRKIKRMEATKK